MMIKASGRSALMLATGLFVCLAGPSQATKVADGAAVGSKSDTAAGAPVTLNKSAKHGARHWKRAAHSKSGKVAPKSSTAKKIGTEVAEAGDLPTVIPPSVADANAQLANADTPSGSAKAMSARASNILLAASERPADAPSAEVVSADQLNDIDRALHAGTPSPTTLAMATADAPAAPVMASSNENSTWDQTTLIGKMFIAFGTLLTMASAARMFMA